MWQAFLFYFFFFFLNLIFGFVFLFPAFINWVRKETSKSLDLLLLIQTFTPSTSSQDWSPSDEMSSSDSSPEFCLKRLYRLSLHKITYSWLDQQDSCWRQSKHYEHAGKKKKIKLMWQAKSECHSQGVVWMWKFCTPDQKKMN